MEDASALPDDELRAELKRLRKSLCDIEDMHAYASAGTRVHIGGERARKMQEEFEGECRTLTERIAALEKELKSRHPRD